MEYHEEIEARMTILEARLAFCEQRIASLERHPTEPVKTTKAGKPRKELTPEEKKAVRARLVAGQERKRKEREVEAEVPVEAPVETESENESKPQAKGKEAANGTSTAED